MRRIFVPLAAAFFVGCTAETFTSPGPTGVEVLHGPPAIVSLATELDSLLLIRVVDDEGRPSAGARVTWQVIDGDGILVPSDSVSGPDGLASARWKFNLIPGLQRAQVAVAGGDPVTFVTEARAFRAIQVTAGYSHGCGIDAEAVTWCWGGDSTRLGNAAAGSYTLRPTRVSGGHTFAEVQAGESVSCGRTPTGEVWCWGWNWSGGLGQGSTTLANSALPLRVSGLPALTAIVLGDAHGCGLGVDSTAWCWGKNGNGESGTAGVGGTAGQVVTPLRFVALALGGNQSCGLTGLGTAYCWGWGQNGLLGDSGSSRNAPTGPVLGGHQFVQISAGYDITCGRDAAGAAWCWGYSRGHEGLPPGPHPTPIRLPFPVSVSGITIGDDYTAGIGIGGQVMFHSFRGENSLLPEALRSIPMRQIAGRYSFCLIGATGDVYCSGEIVDQVNCSSLPPTGCSETGAIPRPTGGRVTPRWPGED
ncbi:MAG: hypothetical protein ABJB33_08860 [Gemmatimonadota bacterium]